MKFPWPSDLPSCGCRFLERISCGAAPTIFCRQNRSPSASLPNQQCLIYLGLPLPISRFFPFLSNSRLSALVPASLRRAPPPCCAAAPRSALPCASTSGASPTVDLAVVNPHCCEHGAFLSSLLIVPRVTKTLGMSHQCALCLALHLRLGYPALEPSLRLCTSASPVGPPRAAGLPGPRIAASVFLWATGASVGFSTFASPSSTVRLQPRRRSSGHTTFHSLNSLHCFYLLVSSLQMSLLPRSCCEILKSKVCASLH